MKLVVQRVQSARVLVEGKVVGEIGRGALILLGVARNDTPFDLRYLARKASQLRIFDDENGQLNASIESARGAFLVVSQFTLYGDCAKGNRPSYIEAAPPDQAALFYDDFVRELQTLGHPVQTGRFGEKMLVELQNDGPVTLLLESRGRMIP